jgi:hypothetical protein
VFDVFDAFPVKSQADADAAPDAVFVQFDNATVAYRKDVPLDNPEAQAVCLTFPSKSAVFLFVCSFVVTGVRFV